MAIAAAQGAAQIAIISRTQPGTMSGAGVTATGGAGGGAMGISGGTELSSFPSREEPRATQNVTVNIQNGSGSGEYWQRIVEDNIVPAINAAVERNIRLTVVTA